MAGFGTYEQPGFYGPDDWAEAEELLETLDEGDTTVEETVETLGYWLSDALLHDEDGADIRDQTDEVRVRSRRADSVSAEIQTRKPGESPIYSSISYRTGKKMNEKGVPLPGLRADDDSHATKRHRASYAGVGIGGGGGGYAGGVLAQTDPVLGYLTALGGVLGGVAIASGVQGYVDASRDEQKRARIDALVEDAGDYMIDVY